MSSRDKNPARAPLVEDSSSEDSRQVPRRLLADQDRISKPSELHAGRSREQRKRIHSANLAKTPVGGRGPKQSGSSSGRQGPHYTVSKDCSRPEDVNREFRLKWIIESLEDLSGPVSPSAGIRARGAAGPATNSLRKMAFHPGIPEIELLPKPEDESPSPEGEKLSPNSPLSELDSVEEADAQLVPTLIEWNHGGEIVYVTGTFTNWEKKYRLHQRSVFSGDDVLVLV